jgi:uncharacterized tellurite resistance protein B-like protein
MDFQSVTTHLYYLVVYADGKFADKEVALGKQMAKLEGFEEKTFDSLVESLKEKDKNVIFTHCIAGLKKLDKKQQVKCIAWLCVIANGDGFMDKEEWTLIYKIYHTELGLSLNEIMDAQKELNKTLFGSSFQSFGVKVND